MAMKKKKKSSGTSRDDPTSRCQEKGMAAGAGNGRGNPSMAMYTGIGRSIGGFLNRTRALFRQES